MIGDISRTGTYRKAILGNAEVAFRAKTVLDVGAGESRRSIRDEVDVGLWDEVELLLIHLKTGSGILSYMAAQAGASEVIALEASSMADKITTVSEPPPRDISSMPVPRFPEFDR